MFKKLFFILCVLINTSVFSQEYLSNVNSIQLEEHFFSTTTSFDVTANNKKIGVIKADFLSLSPVFRYYDNNNKLIAKASVALFSLTTTITVVDSNNKLIGKIKHEVFENLFSFENTYSIYIQNNVKIADSRKLDIISTNIRLVENNKNTVFINRPALTFTDIWNIEISNSKIDRRLILFIPVFKTYYDNSKK